MFPLQITKLLYKGQNSNRGLSPGVWGDCDLIKHGDDLNNWRFWADDFVHAGAALTANHALWGPYDAFGTLGVTFGALQSAMVSLLRSTLDADTEEAYVGFGAFGSPLVRFDDELDGDMFFEGRVRYSTVANTVGLAKMFGLAQVGIPVTGGIAAGGAALANQEFVGFRALIADGDGMDAVYQTGAAEVVVKEAAAETSLNLTADTYVKLGMRWRSRKNLLEFYVNGVKVAELTTDVAFFAATFFAPFFGERQVGAGTFTRDVDWLACAQRVAPY